MPGRALGGRWGWAADGSSGCQGCCRLQQGVSWLPPPRSCRSTPPPPLLPTATCRSLHRHPRAQGFPSGAGSLAAAGFHGGLAAICGLYLLFWLRLNLMQTLPLLAALGVATAACGGATLRGLAAEQRKPTKQE